MNATTLVDPGVDPIAADPGDRPSHAWATDESTDGSAELELTDRELTDEELTAQALAATPRTMADDAAVSYWDVVAPQDLGLLPAWYMPTPSAGSRRLRGWRRRVAYLVTGSIVLINAAGLCVTYGRVTLG